MCVCARARAGCVAGTTGIPAARTTIGAGAPRPSLHPPPSLPPPLSSPPSLPSDPPPLLSSYPCFPSCGPSASPALPCVSPAPLSPSPPSLLPFSPLLSLSPCLPLLPALSWVNLGSPTHAHRPPSPCLPPSPPHLQTERESEREREREREREICSFALPVPLLPPPFHPRQSPLPSYLHSPLTPPSPPSPHPSYLHAHSPPSLPSSPLTPPLSLRLILARSPPLQKHFTPRSPLLLTPRSPLLLAPLSPARPRCVQPPPNHQPPSSLPPCHACERGRPATSLGAALCRDGSTAAMGAVGACVWSRRRLFP